MLYPYAYSGQMVSLDTIKASHSWQQLHSEVQRRAEALLVDSEGKVGFGQGWRSPQEADAVFVQRHHIVPCPGITFQGKCWALNPGKAPSMPADRSYHCPTPLPQDSTNLAMAIDFVGDMQWFSAHCASYGFVNMIGGEIWHGQPPEFPHARGDYNANPSKYHLGIWPLPGSKPQPGPELPPTEEDDMKWGILRLSDAFAVFTGPSFKNAAGAWTLYRIHWVQASGVAALDAQTAAGNTVEVEPAPGIKYDHTVVKTMSVDKLPFGDSRTWVSSEFGEVG